MTSFGVEPSVGPEVEKYSTPLMLRWIARWTSDWIRSGMDARSRPAAALIFAPRLMAGRLPVAAVRLGRGRRGGVSVFRSPRVHLLQHDLDLAELVLDVLQSLGHADHLGAARQVHVEEIFLHEIAELLLRAGGGAAGLIHRLGKLRRRHGAVGEGVEPLLHLADHGLPQCNGIAALVSHRFPPQPRGVSALLFRHTTPLRRDGQRLSTRTGRYSVPQISFCAATNRAIEFRHPKRRE